MHKGCVGRVRYMSYLYGHSEVEPVRDGRGLRNRLPFLIPELPAKVQVRLDGAVVIHASPRLASVPIEVLTPSLPLHPPIKVKLKDLGMAKDPGGRESRTDVCWGSPLMIYCQMISLSDMLCIIGHG